MYDVPLCPPDVFATISEDPAGGPVRTIITGRQHRPTGFYCSAKVGRPLPWEDRRERMAFWICEADAEVVTYLAQPHRLEIPAGRKPLVYFPDVRLDYADGRVEILEIKKFYRPKPDYAQKLALASEIYEGIGWTYRMLTEGDLRAGYRLGNAKRIQADRHTRVTVQQAFCAVDAVEAGGGCVAYGRVREALGGGPAGAAYLHRLIVQRVLRVNLDAKLDVDAPVYLVDLSARSKTPPPERH
jgi:hypothetical protein